MDIQAALFYHLTNAAAVAALVSTRVYPRIAPPDAALPNIVYRKVSRNQKRAHSDQPGSGQKHLVYRRIQIDCTATSADGADALAKAVRQALDSFQGVMGGTGGLRVYSTFVENVNDGYEFESKNGVAILDVMIGYQEV